MRYKVIGQIGWPILNYYGNRKYLQNNKIMNRTSMTHQKIVPCYLSILLVSTLFLLNGFSTNAQTKAEQLGWKQLFNGKDLTGWQHVGGGSRFVEDGSYIRLKDVSIGLVENWAIVC